MGAGTTFLAVAAMTLTTVVAVCWQQRSLRRDGSRRSTSIGDGLGNLIDVFEPGQARATRDLQEQRHQGPVTPVPDRDPDDPVQLEIGPGGEPLRVRVRRSR